MIRLLAIIIAVAPAFGQMMPGRLFPTQLKEYLGVTDAQVASINKLNSDYTALILQKQLRSGQVQRELALETAKEQLDPMALGLRYVELETIRREINEELRKTRTSAVALLNDAQKLKLKALEEALKLQPRISEAQCENLLEASPFPGSIIPANRLSPIRSGDFTDSISGILIPSLYCGTATIMGTFSPMRP